MIYEDYHIQLTLYKICDYTILEVRNEINASIMANIVEEDSVTKVTNTLM